MDPAGRSELGEQERYWQATFASPPGRCDLPLDGARRSDSPPARQRSSGIVPRSLWHGLQEFCARLATEPFVGLLAALKALLMRCTQQEDLTVGSLSVQRRGKGAGGGVEPAINPVALRTSLANDPTAIELLHRVATTTRAAAHNRDYPFYLLRRFLRERFAMAEPSPFQVLFVPVDLPGGVSESPLEESHLTAIAEYRARCDLVLLASERAGDLVLSCEYDPECFYPTTIRRFLSHLQALVREMVADPRRRLSQLSILTAAERHQLLVEWNEAGADEPGPQCVHQLFEARAERHPDRVAVVFGERWVSYRELNRRANRLAHYLRRLGVGAQVRVGLSVERSAEMVVGLLAILKAEGVYVPLDPANPQQRLAAMVADAGLAVLLSRRSTAARLPALGTRRVELGAARPAIAQASPVNPSYPADPDQLAYVMYTSGSAGQPKGVGIPHRAIVRLVRGPNYIAIGCSDCVAQASNAAFDGATFEIWGALLNGARLVGLPREVLLAPRALKAEVRRRGITTLFLTTALFNRAIAEQPTAFRTLRALLFGGEAVDPEQVCMALRHGAPQRLLHVYGPTETTTFATWYRVREVPEGARAVPIGGPLSGTELFVLDGGLHPAPPGSRGELFIGGVGLARGYHRRPRLTAERFLPHPFARHPGQRLYRTGDLVRQRPDGVLEFMGRRDHQMKIRGFRIEPGEIEAALIRHPAVRDAVVVRREVAPSGPTPGDRRLVAYVVAAESTPEQQQAWQQEHMVHWRSIFEDLYRKPSPTGDPSFNTAGWNSSFTGQPIPPHEMREWVERTVARIRSLRPQRVLEIGCGTGLLLLRLAPHCRQYLGTDFSATGIESLGRQLAASPPLSQVRLSTRAADDFKGLTTGAFDTVVINSLTQYLPGIEVLLRVLRRTVKLVSRGGSVFVGDVRSLPLLAAFHAAVELRLVDDALPLSELRQRLGRRARRDEELVIDPAFFLALQRELPRIRRVRVLLKEGRYPNEMTCFRYDVILQLDETTGEAGDDPSAGSVSWLDWQHEGLTLAAVRSLLKVKRPTVLGLRQVPNRRVVGAVQARDRLADPGPLRTAGDLRRAIRGAAEGIDPDELATMARRAGYGVETSWAGSDPGGSFDVLLWQLERSPLPPPFPLPAESASARPWSAYASDVDRRAKARWLTWQLRERLEPQVPEYMMPAAFMVLDALPLSATGKVDRRALPEPVFTRPQLPVDFVAPRSAMERALAEIWCEALDIERVGVHDDFFQLGGDSLLAIRMISRVRHLWGIELPLRKVFDRATVADLTAELVTTPGPSGAERPATAAAVPPIRPVSRRRVLPLSFAQQRLWFLQRLDPGDTAYNIPIAFRLEGRLEVAALARCFATIVARHQVLRTTFSDLAGRPRQVITGPPDVPLPLVDLESVKADQRLRAFRRLANEESNRPFDPARGPLCRFTLFRLHATDHVLFLIFHHIAFDGWSEGVFYRELTSLYEAFTARRCPALPELEIQYADFAVWQRQWLSGRYLADQLAYWRGQLAELPLVALPLDRPRSPATSRRAGFHRPALGESLLRDVRTLGSNTDATLFMTLLAAFFVLLHRYTGQEDLVVGSPIANRGRPEIEVLVGFFVNLLVLRVSLAGNPSFRQLLARVREVTLGAYAHQDLPFEKLVEELQPDRDPSHSPLFQVMFALYRTLPARPQLPGLRCRTVGIDAGPAKYDLTLAVTAAQEGSAGEWEYPTQLFDAVTIRRFAQHYETLLLGIVEDPQRRLSDLPLMPPAQRHQLLTEWSERPAMESDGTFPEIFAVQVAKTPSRVALVCGEHRISYQELHRRANRLAHALQARGVGPEVPVGVCLERSPDLVAGILAILKAGGVYLPLDPDHPQKRLGWMLRDARAGVVLTRARWANRLRRHGTPVMRVDTAERSAIADHPHAPGRALAGHLAYLIYTSGSTGTPKGVAVSHQALVRHCLNIRERFRLTADDRVLQLSAISFDASLEQLLVPLITGATVVLEAEKAWVPSQLRATLSQLRVTVADLPATIWRELVREWTRSPHPVAIPGLRLLIVGGEAMLLADLRRWEQIPLASVGLLNAYGPTEAAITATSFTVPERFGAAAGPDTVPIGTPVGKRSVFVLDHRGAPVPIGGTGELGIGGQCLARGYWDRPALTADRFTPDPFSAMPGARLYRTGDLARYLGNGNLLFLGRIDHQVKVRGCRIELGEIEAVLTRHPQLREVAVSVWEKTPGDHHLVAHVVADQEPAPGTGQLRAFLRQQLPDFMVPSAFVAVAELPRTASGKIDRSKLARSAAASTSERDPASPEDGPRNPLEEMVAGIWAQLLGMERVAVNDDFFRLGGHSLVAVQVMARIRELLGVEIPLRSLFEAPTVAALARRVGTAMTAGAAVPALPMQRAPRDQPLPLSSGQRRLWTLAELAPDGAFNIPLAFRLEGRLEVVALERAFAALIQRHDSLRTFFPIVGGEPVQVVAPGRPPALGRVCLRRLVGKDREAEARRVVRTSARRRFALARGPLLYAILVDVGNEDRFLVAVMHHIVFDGWSVGIFLRELTALYRAFSSGQPSPLVELPVQYADFSLWERRWLAGPALNRQLDYWRERLAGPLPVLHLPTDRPRPPRLTHRGRHQMLAFSRGLHQALGRLSRREHVTLYMTLLAAFHTLLFRLSHQDDLLVGSPIAQRQRRELEGVIGFFVNTLVLRTDLAGDPSFRELLGRERETALGAYTHCDLPFEKLVRELQPERDLAATPLFQVMFAFEKVPPGELTIPGVKVSALRVETGAVMYELSLSLEETAGDLFAIWDYATGLYDPTTVRRLHRQLESLLAAAGAEPGRRLSELPLLPPAQRHQLLVEWNATFADYRLDGTAQEMLARRARQVPDAVAVVTAEKRLSYAELERRANQLGHYLRGLGAGPETRVGVVLPPCAERIIGILGILKAGGAWVPLAADLPPNRLAFLLDDNQIGLVVTLSCWEDQLPASVARVVCLDIEAERIAKQSPVSPALNTTSENLAYVIYTSGSTGCPKGVMLTHRGLCNLAAAQAEAFRVRGRTRHLQFAPASYDASVSEVFMALYAGAELVMESRDSLLPGDPLLALLRRQKISNLTLPPSVLSALSRVSLPALETLVVAGEMCRAENVDRWAPGRRFFNAYGPTETTVCASTMRVLPGDGKPSIGRPIANTQLYALNSRLQPVAFGSTGELHVGGVGLARGYHQRPALTAERFIPNPFSDQPGSRLYRTGDLVRYLRNGEIDFLGRRDLQVKVRGYRIELGEVEAVLGRHQQVREAAVTVWDEESQDKRLVAYVVPNPEAVLTAEDLRRFLSENLPRYMVPATFVIRQALARTATGKVDRTALGRGAVPAHGAARPAAEPPRSTPRNPIEEQLAKIFSQLLGVESVGIHDDFFALGGHSLLATQVLARIAETLQVELTLMALFESPSVAALAEHVSAAMATATAVGDL